MKIEGSTALVTGGAHRLGRAIAGMLAGAGANVAINFHSAATAAEEAVVALRAAGIKALAVQADIGRPEQVAEMAARIEAELGAPDILINSADHFAPNPFPAPDLTRWQQITATGIDGPYYVCNRFAPQMLARGRGAIINIVDGSAWEPWPHFTAHAVAKSAQLALTRQLALELAPAVRVNAVAPGPVLAPAAMSQARKAALADETLLARWGAPADVCGAVRYLIEADYVTGEVLVVDGGQRYGRYAQRG